MDNRLVERQPRLWGRLGQGWSSGAFAAGRGYWEILATNLFSFFHVILLVVGLILILFGRYNDAFITVIAAMVSVLIRTVQEVRAKRQLDRIAVLVRPSATLVREGEEVVVDAAEMAAGDVFRLWAGDQAAADGRVTGAGMAELDESLLTGESDLVRKQSGDPIHSGSFCVNGSVDVVAETVGEASTAQRFTEQARSFTKTLTPLQQQTGLVIRVLMVVAVCMAAIFYIGGFLDQSSLIQFVAGSAVLIGLVPYGLFLTISLAYTLGAVTIGKAGAIVQQTQAVELLKHVDVLCLDKTGTLTTNQLQVASVLPLGDADATQVHARLGDFVRSSSTQNATSQAILRATDGMPRSPLDEVPFASARKWSALALPGNEEATGAPAGVYVLGALEMLQPYLVSYASVGEEVPEWVVQIQSQAQRWADEGLRVLLFAGSAEAEFLHDESGAPVLPPLVPWALVALRDKLRPHALEMLQRFIEMGIEVKIISGDNPRTVAALVKQLGLFEPKLVTGPELAGLEGAAFAQAVNEATVFGRIAPEQKAHIVDALMDQGRYVAMLGDGVNDILALKRAKLGIALQSGSSATRNVADMILLNDSYAALAPALDEGRRIYSGLSNAMHLTLARSFTYALVIVGVLMAGLDFPMEPAQTGVTLITVGLPAFFLTVWARPQTGNPPLLPSLLRFVLPVALWSMLIGVTLYAVVHFHINSALEGFVIPARVVAAFERYTGLSAQADVAFSLTAARAMAQTALSIFLTLSALLLILFLEPPVRWLATWRDVSPDRRPTWLALGLLALFLVGLGFPTVTDYLGFIPSSLIIRPVWRDILVGLILWVGGLWLMWRMRWLDRLFGLETPPSQ